MVLSKLIPGYKHIYRIGSPHPNDTYKLYKYMNVQRAINFLRTREFCFVEPTMWHDPYESRFYKADYKNVNYKPIQLFCTCLTNRMSNEAAWRMYRGNNGGIEDRTIRFDFKRSSLLKALDKTGIKFYLGYANYAYTKKQIDEIHKNTNPEYEKLFSNFSEDKFVNLLLIKRKAFEYESEVRLFMKPEYRKPNNGDYIEINNNIKAVRFCLEDLIDMVNQISVDPSCSELEYKMIASYVKQISSEYLCRHNGLYRKSTKIIIE